SLVDRRRRWRTSRARSAETRGAEMNSSQLTRFSTIASSVAIISLMIGQVYAATVAVNVPGTANPYLAAMPPGSTCCAAGGGTPDSTTNASPVQVNGLNLTAGMVLTFSASGTVSFDAGPHTNGPDGGVFNTLDTFGLDGTPSSNGIAGMLAPQNALVGLFL